MLVFGEKEKSETSISESFMSGESDADYVVTPAGRRLSKQHIGTLLVQALQSIGWTREAQQFTDTLVSNNKALPPVHPTLQHAKLHLFNHRFEQAIAAITDLIPQPHRLDQIVLIIREHQYLTLLQHDKRQQALQVLQRYLAHHLPHQRLASLTGLIAFNNFDSFNLLDQEYCWNKIIGIHCMTCSFSYPPL
jgi:hypothetical protein